MKRVYFLSTLSLLFIISACGSHNESLEEENIHFLVTSPLVKDTTLTREYVCQIKSIQHIELRAMEKGYLQHIYVDEGKFVKKGQVLFQILPMLYEAELEKAKAEYNFALIEYQNTKQLADGNIVAKNELAMAKAKLDKAKAEKDLRKVHLDFTSVRAPFDGIIDRFQVRLGSLVEEGDLLTYLSDNSKMWVYFNVPEAEYLAYKTQPHNDSLSKVKLQMANHEIFPFPGKIETIEAEFDNETGNISFRATFPNPKDLLRHGETGNILIPSRLKNAILIPQKATFEVLEKKFVFIVDDQSIVHQKEIQIAGELPDIYIIKDGLNPKDRILYEGIRKVTNGEKIKYQYQSSQKVFQQLRVYTE